VTNRLERLALQRHLRISERRRIILQVLDKAQGPTTAQEVYRRTRETYQGISLSTIHRTLNLLTEAGLLRRLEFGVHKTRYEKADAQRHDRLIDVRTGRLLEFRSEGIEGLLKHIVHELGYRLLDYRLDLFGTPERSAANRAAPPIESQARSTDPQADGSPPHRSQRRSRH
jgi:Fur family ferric uptake transcriptional regulator